MNHFIKKNQNKEIIILDIPLYLENKMNKKKDIMIFIKSKKKEILKRIIKRKNFNLRLYKKFKTLQLPIEVKKKKCKYIINNNFTKDSIKKDIKKILKKILKND